MHRFQSVYIIHFFQFFLHFHGNFPASLLLLLNFPTFFLPSILSPHFEMYLSSYPPHAEPTVTPSPTPQPDIHFTQNHYEAKFFAGQPNSGAEVTTIALKVEHPQLISSWTHNFGLNGFYSDFFSIGHTSGIITVASTVTPKLYSFDVTAFITGNFSNGTTFTNFTEADVSILVHG